MNDTRTFYEGLILVRVDFFEILTSQAARKNFLIKIIQEDFEKHVRDTKPYH